MDFNINMTSPPFILTKCQFSNYLTLPSKSLLMVDGHFLVEFDNFVHFLWILKNKLFYIIKLWVFIKYLFHTIKCHMCFSMRHATLSQWFFYWKIGHCQTKKDDVASMWHPRAVFWRVKIQGINIHFRETCRY